MLCYPSPFPSPFFVCISNNKKIIMSIQWECNINNVLNIMYGHFYESKKLKVLKNECNV